MADPFGLEMSKQRQEDLRREAEGRRIARSLREARRAAGRQTNAEKRVEPVIEGRVVVRWGLAEDEPAVADLLEMNGVPRWVAFEERFIVAQRDGEVLGALRYRTESKRLLLGLLAVDPWAGERRMAIDLYRGAGGLAGELGVGEIVASAAREGYPGLAGYQRRGRSWRLDSTDPRGDAGGPTSRTPRG